MIETNLLFAHQIVRLMVLGDLKKMVELSPEKALRSDLSYLWRRIKHSPMTNLTSDEEHISEVYKGDISV